MGGSVGGASEGGRQRDGIARNEGGWEGREGRCDCYPLSQARHHWFDTSVSRPSEGASRLLRFAGWLAGQTLYNRATLQAGGGGERRGQERKGSAMREVGRDEPWKGVRRECEVRSPLWSEGGLTIPTCPPGCMCLHLHLRPATYPHACPSLPLSLPAYLSAYLLTSLPTHQTLHPTVPPSILPSLRPSLPPSHAASSPSFTIIDPSSHPPTFIPCPDSLPPHPSPRPFHPTNP